jgi:hypothetical protein
MSAPVSREFTPRSASAWAALCAAALPPAARQILREAHAAGGRQVDAADAWIAFSEQKTEAQARSKARREQVKGWGTCARAGEAEAAQGDQIPITPPPGMGEWALHQDPADARAVLEIRSALENCDALAALGALGLSDLAQDPAAVKAVNRLRAEMKRWAALDDLDEADSGDIALRDRVTRRMAQMALKAQREAVEAGQGVLI